MPLAVQRLRLAGTGRVSYTLLGDDALPVGPVQTDCEYANPCLDCNFFLTTVEFLPAHRRQRDETEKMVTEAKDQGLVRIVEKNTATLARLDHLIERLEGVGPDTDVGEDEGVADAAG